MAFELTMNKELTYAKGTIGQLQIVSCVYSPEKRDSTRNLVSKKGILEIFELMMKMNMYCNSANKAGAEHKLFEYKT